MRKLIKKYWVGGGLTSPTYTPTYNTGTDLYNQITNRNFNSLGNQFSNEILKGPLQNDEILRNKVQYDTTTENTLKNLSGITSSIIGTGKKFTKGKGLFSKENIGGTMQIAGQVADMLGGFLPEKSEYQGTKGNVTRAIDTGYDAASDIAMSINPIVGGAMKVGGFVSDGINAITGGTDGMTTTDAIFGSTLGNLLGVGIINSAFGKKADTMYKDNTTWEQQGSSYGGSLAKVDDAMTKSGKKYGAFSGRGRRAANRQIAEAKRQQGVIQGINNEAQDAFLSSSNMESINNIGTSFQLQGGYNQQNVRMGRHGMNIQTLNRAKSILKNLNKSQEIEWLDTLSYDPTEITLVNPNDIPEFQEGGSINVIPEGALHARKHNMDMEGITKKGIPVVADKENGGVEQQAEIEREEIIFRLEVTKKLEELEKKYYNSDTSQKEKDELALEAGKLLVQEILYNTMDNVNLINKV